MADDKLTNPSGPEERAHGAHGKGDAREQRVDDTEVKPATKEAGQARNASDPTAADKVRNTLTGHMGDAAWGDAASGGSTIDKRPPDKR